MGPPFFCMTEWNQISLQDAISPVIEEFIFFHDYLLLALIYIITRVAYFILLVRQSSYIDRGFLEGQLLETIWTVIPALVLVVIAIPSLMLLYRLDSVIASGLTLKVLGHQWYWRYEYTDFWSFGSGTVLSFDAYIVPENELAPGLARLLETDNRPVLPFLSRIRVLIRRADVLHSWAVPSLGVKLDATPGRLNQTVFSRYRPGLAYGQCSEICGANHRFMPIRLEFVSIEDFLQWVEAVVRD